jgi:Tfp pilus assembly protein PilF/S1-C subfamily serine protease
MLLMFASARITALLGLGITIALVQSAAAKTPTEIDSIAKSMTVLISGSEGQGSGVIIHKQGNIYTAITAAHVFKSNNYQIITADDRQHSLVASSIRKASGDIDLAVFKFQATASYPVAKIGNSSGLSGGSDIYVAGFPASTRTITASVFVFRRGEVSANSSKVFTGGYSLIYSNNTLPGMSGGPVLNNEGELVAIHGKGDREESDSGLGAKTGFNLGIPIERFLTIAKTLGVPLEIAPTVARAVGGGEDALAAGLQKERQNDYRGALIEYDRAIALDPRYADAYVGRGFAKSKLGENSSAIGDFSTAIALNPKSARAYQNRGTMYLEFKDWEYAIRDFDRAIDIDTNYAEAYIGRGVARESWPSSKTGGMADLNMAIILAPKSALAHRSRAAAKLDTEDYRGAVEDYTKAMSLSTNTAVDLEGRGMAKAKLKDYSGAISDYVAAIKIAPDRASSFYQRGLAKFELNDRNGAVQDLKKSQQLLVQQGQGKSFQSDKITRLLKKWG